MCNEAIAASAKNPELLFFGKYLLGVCMLVAAESRRVLSKVIDVAK
jgi:hypothetical protein